MKKILAIVVLCCSTYSAFADDLQTLTQAMQTQDKRLFEMIYGTCDIQELDKMIADDFEFYHDIGGVSPSKSAFMESMRKGSCKDNPAPSDFTSYRVMVDGTFQVFPLKENDKIYALLTTGEHAFYESYKGSNLSQTSVAKFSNLWTLEDTQWKLSRVLSYDHQISGK